MINTVNVIFWSTIGNSPPGATVISEASAGGAVGSTSVVLVGCGGFASDSWVGATVGAAGAQALRIMAKRASHETKRIFLFITISFSISEGVLNLNPSVSHR
jgi:hypothetical protein